jgi:hypothetical protein
VPDPTPEILVREMSATPLDVARGLEAAFPDAVGGGPLAFEVRGSEGVQMTVQLNPGPERVIALLRLPTLTARIRLHGGDDQARAAMLRRFDLATRRGGG